MYIYVYIYIYYVYIYMYIYIYVIETANTDAHTHTQGCPRVEAGWRFQTVASNLVVGFVGFLGKTAENSGLVL